METRTLCSGLHLFLLVSHLELQSRDHGLLGPWCRPVWPERMASYSDPCSPSQGHGHSGTGKLWSPETSPHPSLHSHLTPPPFRPESTEDLPHNDGKNSGSPEDLPDTNSILREETKHDPRSLSLKCPGPQAQYAGVRSLIKRHLVLLTGIKMDSTKKTILLNR